MWEVNTQLIVSRTVPGARLDTLDKNKPPALALDPIGPVALAGGATLKATVAQPPAAGGPGAGGPFAFGQGQVVAGSSTVHLNAPVDLNLILLAIALALLGGLVAGAIGGVRAARLRPAAALRSVE